MEETNKLEQASKHEHCYMCHGHEGMACAYHQRHLLLRWLLGVLILVVTFWLGFKLGEIKGIYGDGGFGYGRMWYGQPQMYYRWGGGGTGNQGYSVPPMMRWWQQQASGTPASTTK